MIHRGRPGWKRPAEAGIGDTTQAVPDPAKATADWTSWRMYAPIGRRGMTVPNTEVAECYLRNRSISSPIFGNAAIELAIEGMRECHEGGLQPAVAAPGQGVPGLDPHLAAHASAQPLRRAAKPQHRRGRAQARAGVVASSSPTAKPQEGAMKVAAVSAAVAAALGRTVVQ
jgi:hypothetical protein